ncbi:MAG: SUMF1/EgtB/PvdO family nonheme iron enzyme [Byssovorax sp.]
MKKTPLLHKDILDLHGEAIAVGLARHRDVLLLGVADELIAEIPSERTPAAQMLADLDKMNAAGVLEDGAFPLEVWLKNAVSQATARTNTILFEKMLGLCADYKALPDRSTATFEPKPRYQDHQTQLLSQQLEDARKRKRELSQRGADASEAQKKIDDLRRTLRDGGQLRAGDPFADGRYLLIEKIGKGGFASVWLAFDRERKRMIAIKVLHADVAEDPVKRGRFFAGAKTMMSLQHEAIVQILDPHGEDHGYFFFSMDFIDGHNLDRTIASRLLSGEAAIQIMIKVSDALALAHARSMIHRDIKPSNILLDAEHRPFLTDFDLVHDPERTYMTHTKAQFGTWAYSAPELLGRDQDITAAADVFSLGMTLFYCLRGELPPRGDTYTERLDIIDDLAQPARVKNVLKRALNSEPSKRFPDAAQFRDALQEALTRTQQAARMATYAYKSVLVAAAAGLVLSGVVWAVMGRTDKSPDPTGDDTTHRADEPSARAPVSTGSPTASALPPVLLPSAVTSASPSASPAPEPVPPCPNGMKYFVARPVDIGSLRDKGNEDGYEYPQHRVVLGPFCFDETEVTVGAYRECVKAGLCKAPNQGSLHVGLCTWDNTEQIREQDRPKHPMNCVKWSDAKSFCEWAKKRLPTEEEWEYVARGADGQREYPWGDSLYPEPNKRLNACERRCVEIKNIISDPNKSSMYDGPSDGYGITAPVGSYPKGATPEGIVDMAGNVAEWTDSPFCRYEEPKCATPSRVIRGGSWYTSNARFVRAAHREGAQPEVVRNFIGFRCAKTM